MNSGSPYFEAHEQVLLSLLDQCHDAVIDGPVECSRYASAKPRLLWILREVNGKGPWDLREFLRDRERLMAYPRWHSTYGAIVKISYGLINCSTMECIEKLRARDVVDTIRDVAVVNVNKRGGKERVTWGKLVENAKDFTPFVERQIAALDPEIIIAAGTASLLPNSLRDCLLECSTSSREPAIRAIRFRENTWLVKCYHTGQTRISHAHLYGLIVSALRKEGWTMPGGVSKTASDG